MHLIKSALLLILFACLPFRLPPHRSPSPRIRWPQRHLRRPCRRGAGQYQYGRRGRPDTGLNGVGEAKARAILEYRAAHGPFVSVDQLLEVKGVGPALLEKNRSRIVIE